MKQTVIRSILIFLALVIVMATLHLIVNWSDIAPELIKKIHGG